MLLKSAIKRILFFCIVLSVLSLECWAQSGKLKEEVKYTYEFIAEFGEYKPQLKSKYIYKYTYDERGNVVDVTTYDFQGELDFKVVTKYDEKGNPIERTWYDFPGTLVKKFFYKYDEKGNQVESTTYDSQGQLKCKFLTKYDEKGNMVEQIYDNSPWSKSVYKYDGKGNMVEEATYYSDGKLMWKTTYKYDEKGNIVEKLGHHLWLRSDGRTTYKYDEEGDEVVVMEYIWKSAFGKTQEIPVEKTVHEYEYY